MGGQRAVWVAPEVDEGGAGSAVGPFSGRRVAMRRASERSVAVGEVPAGGGSWEVITMSRGEVTLDEVAGLLPRGPVQTVAGSTRARRPSPGRSLGDAAATKAAPSPAVADACRDLRRRESSF